MQFFVYCLMWCAILVFMEKFFLGKDVRVLVRAS